MRVLLALVALVLAGPALAQQSPMWLQDWPSSWTDGPTLRLDRFVPDGASGKPGYTYKALWALTSTGRDNAGYEWAITGEVHNRTLGSTGAQQVAVNGTIWKDANGVGPVGPSWALNGNCVDLTGENDPVYSCIGLELDVSGAAGTTDKNRQRVGLHVSAGGNPGAHAGYAMLVSPTAGAVIDRAIGLQGGGGSYGIGLDTTAGRFTSAPIVLGASQALAMDGDPATGAFNHWLAYNGEFLGFFTHGGAFLQVHNDGRLVAQRLVEEAPRVPTSSSSPCQRGERAWDERFEYRCISANRWKRTALTDF